MVKPMSTLLTCKDGPPRQIVSRSTCIECDAHTERALGLFFAARVFPF